MHHRVRPAQCPEQHFYAGIAQAVFLEVELCDPLVVTQNVSENVGALLTKSGLRIESC